MRAALPQSFDTGIYSPLWKLSFDCLPEYTRAHIQYALLGLDLKQKKAERSVQRSGVTPAEQR